MSVFSFVTSKPATYITDNLYLGDKNHVPDDADFILVCSIELADAYSKNFKNYKELKKKKIIYDEENKRAFFKFKDWPNFKSIIIEDTVTALNLINDKIKAKQKVYVHCVYGVNRSASHCFMYMVGTGKIQKPTYRKAMNEFKKIYPGINPIFGWKKLLKLYFPYTQFFNPNEEILSQRQMIAKYRKDKWIKKVKKKAKKRKEKAKNDKSF